MCVRDHINFLMSQRPLVTSKVWTLKNEWLRSQFCVNLYSPCIWALWYQTWVTMPLILVNTVLVLGKLNRTWPSRTNSEGCIAGAVPKRCNQHIFKRWRDRDREKERERENMTHSFVAPGIHGCLSMERTNYAQQSPLYWLKQVVWRPLGRRKTPKCGCRLQKIIYTGSISAET